MAPEEIAYLTGMPVEQVLATAKEIGIEPEMVGFGSSRRSRFVGVDGHRLYVALMARPVSRKVAEKVLRAVEEMYGPFPEDARPGDRPFLKEPGEETETGWAVCWEGGNEWPIMALDALQKKVPEAFLEPLSSWGLGVYRPW